MNQLSSNQIRIGFGSYGNEAAVVAEFERSGEMWCVSIGETFYGYGETMEVAIRNFRKSFMGDRVEEHSPTNADLTKPLERIVSARHRGYTGRELWENATQSEKNAFNQGQVQQLIDKGVK